MNYSNYSTINNCPNATEKNWCISLSNKPVKQISVSLSDGGKYPYVSRFALDVGNVVVIGKGYAYTIASWHGKAETTGKFGVVSDISDKITVKKDALVELDMVFTDQADKAKLTACGKYIALPANQKSLQFDKATDNIYPITFMIRKILASASILANQKTAGGALVMLAKEYIASNQHVSDETLELRRACPEYADIALWDIYVANKNRCNAELSGEPRYSTSDEALDGFTRHQPMISDKTQNFVHKSVHIGAISVMVRGGFKNLLLAYLDAEPPIKEFRDEILENIAENGYPELIKLLSEKLA